MIYAYHESYSHIQRNINSVPKAKFRGKPTLYMLLGRMRLLPLNQVTSGAGDPVKRTSRCTLFPSGAVTSCKSCWKTGGLSAANTQWSRFTGHMHQLLFKLFHPDMTFAVDWASNVKNQSIYPFPPSFIICCLKSRCKSHLRSLRFSVACKSNWTSLCDLLPPEH